MKKYLWLICISFSLRGMDGVSPEDNSDSGVKAKGCCFAWCDGWQRELGIQCSSRGERFKEKCCYHGCENITLNPFFGFLYLIFCHDKHGCLCPRCCCEKMPCWDEKGKHLVDNDLGTFCGMDTMCREIIRGGFCCICGSFCALCGSSKRDLS